MRCRCRWVGVCLPPSLFSFFPLSDILLSGPDVSYGWLDGWLVEGERRREGDWLGLGIIWVLVEKMVDSGFGEMAGLGWVCAVSVEEGMIDERNYTA